MKQIGYRYKKLTKSSTRRYWSKEEDLRLAELIENLGENYCKLVEFFKDKSPKDIESRYYKKFKHLKIGFTSEEDAVILRLYRNRKLPIEDLLIIKRKRADEIKKRLETLLSSTGEEINKSFNASSILSSSFSYSSTANIDNKGMTCDEEISPNPTFNLNPDQGLLNGYDVLYQNESQFANNSFNDKSNIASDLKPLKQYEEDDAIFNNNQSNEFDVFNTDLYNNNINWNAFWNTSKDKDLFDFFPMDINDSCIQRLNEPDDSFETSFYNAFKMKGNDNYLDLSEDNDLDKVLNHHFSNSMLVDLLHKKKNLEQILNKMHGISEACYLEEDVKAKSTLTDENFVVFKELYQKLIYQEEEFKQNLDSVKQSAAINPPDLIQDNDQELMKQLSTQIELLMKLIKVNKLKLKLFKRAMLKKT